MMSGYEVLSKYCDAYPQQLADSALSGSLRFSYGYIYGCLMTLFSLDVISYSELRAAKALAEALNNGMLVPTV